MELLVEEVEEEVEDVEIEVEVLVVDVELEVELVELLVLEVDVEVPRILSSKGSKATTLKAQLSSAPTALQLIDVELGLVIGPLSLIAPVPRAPVLLSLCVCAVLGVIEPLEVVSPSTIHAKLDIVDILTLGVLIPLPVAPALASTIET